MLLLTAALSAERITGSPLEIPQTQAPAAQSPAILYFPGDVEGGGDWSVQ